MIRLALIALMLAIAAPAAAQTGMPGPSRDTIAAPAQPGAVTLPETASAPDREVWHRDNGLIAVRNVTRPTLQPLLPAHRLSRGAVIVAPGGGFLGLAIEKEGWDVARWLADHGIAAFVLKYRTLPTPASQPEFADQLMRAIHGEKVSFAPADDTPPEALADGIAALRYIRANAARYGIDPAKIGFMGFSAGGFLTRSVIASGGLDMPAFAAPIYPNMGAMTVPPGAPPMFVATAADDFLLARVTGAPLIDSYVAAKRPIEFHLFASGGHGFGMGVPGTPTAGWLDLYLAWLHGQHLFDGAN